jgi:hypothetical protein
MGVLQVLVIFARLIFIIFPVAIVIAWIPAHFVLLAIYIYIIIMTTIVSLSNLCVRMRKVCMRLHIARVCSIKHRLVQPRTCMRTLS